MKRTQSNHTAVRIALVISLPILLFAGVLTGAKVLPFEDVLSVIFPFLKSTPTTPMADVIILQLRIPRTLTAMLVGGNLALAGAIMQGVFRNPMAEPYIVGVSSGAGLGAVIAVVTGASLLSVFVLPVFAFLFAFATTVLVYTLSIRNGQSEPTTLLLAGIAFSALLSSLTSLILYSTINDYDVSRQILFWMMGDLEAKTATHLFMILPFSVVGVVTMFFIPRVLNILSLGDEHARSLGLDIEATRRALIALVALLTGGAVAVSGMIAFVGLIVPHVVRLIIGPNHKRLLPLSYVAGACFLSFLDILLRALQGGFGITIRLGILTGLVGAPFFLYLLLKRKRGAFI